MKNILRKITGIIITAAMLTQLGCAAMAYSPEPASFVQLMSADEASTGTEVTTEKVKASSKEFAGALIPITDNDYINAITKITVGSSTISKGYEADNYQSTESGFVIGSGAFTDGNNTVTIYADGYKPKNISVTKSEDTYAFVSQSDSLLSSAAVTSVEQHYSSYYNGPLITFDNGSDYLSAITKITVNGEAVSKGSNDDNGNYSISGGSGLFIGHGAFTDGTNNTVVISSKGYKDKTVVISRSGDVYALVSQTDSEEDDISYKTGKTVTEVTADSFAWYTGMLIDGLDSAYVTAVSKITVNGTTISERDSYTDGDYIKDGDNILIRSSAFTDGENTVNIYASAYLLKTVKVTKSENTYTLVSQEDVLQTGAAVTKVEEDPSSYNNGPLITLENGDDYISAVTKITVNGTEITTGYSDASGNYSKGYSDPTIFIGYGAFKDGANTVVITAPGYKVKTVVINKNGDVYTLVSQEDSEPVQISNEAQAVIDLIAAIGNVTLDTEEQINNANIEYNKLTEEQKAEVSNYSVLTAANEKLEELKSAPAGAKLTAPTITKVETATNWSGEVVEGMLIPEIRAYGTDADDAEKAYCTAIANDNARELTVNGTVLEWSWSDDGKPTWTTSHKGMTIDTAAFTEGENTIIIKVEGYYDKKLVVNYDGTSYTFVSQEDVGAGETPPVVNPLADPIADGVYTLHYTAKKPDGSASMIDGMFDTNIKLTVEDGKKTIEILNNAMAMYLLDIAIGLDEDTYKESTKTPYDDADAYGEHKAYVYKSDVEQLDQPHIMGVLVSAMGGQASDIHDYAKYTTANLTFTSIEKGWDDWQSAIDERDNPTGEARTIAALIELGYDTDNDGTLSDDELAAIEGEVDLSYCGLTDLDILKKLSDKVTTLNISGNKLEALPEGLLDNMTGLEKFYAQYNLITDIPEDFFKNNTKLDWISLSSNLLTEIDDKDFAGLAEISEIDLGTNKIKSVSEDAFASNTKLKSLALSENLLTSLPDNLLANQKALTFLGIEENRLTTLPTCINDATALESLYAHTNEITDISTVDFSTLPNLKTLHLMRNRISNLEGGMFDGNENLGFVDLHDNQLTDISADVIPVLADGVTRYSFDITLNNIEVVPQDFRIKLGSQKVYPQKSVAGLEASAGDKTISYTQDVSLLNLRYWYDQTNDDKKQELATVDEYKTYLANINADFDDIAATMIDDYNWTIETEVQKKNEDGSFETVTTKSVQNTNDTLSDEFTVEDYGIYRIVKAISMEGFLGVVRTCEVISDEVTLGEAFTVAQRTVKASVNNGDTLIVPIEITNNSGFVYGGMTASWDSAALELTEVEDAAKVDITNSPQIAQGISSYKISFGNMLATSNNTSTGVFFNLKFKVLDSEKVYGSKVTVQIISLLDSDINDVAASGAVIEITEKGTSATHTTISPKTDEGVSGTVALSNMPESFALIVAGYKNGQLVDARVTELTDKTESQPFTLSGSVDSVKVFVWNSLTNMEPVTDTEPVSLSE